MTREQQLEHRLAMILDDLNVLRNFLYNEGLGYTSLQKQTATCDEAAQHLTNIEIACDLGSDESLTWKLYGTTNQH